MQIICEETTHEPTEVHVPHYDPHVHGRRSPIMEVVVPEAAKRMCGGIFEPNTNPHLETFNDVSAYVTHANELTPSCRWSGSIYLKPDTDRAEVSKAWKARLIGHVKRYPPHGTTYSDEGVTPEMMLDKNSNTGQLLSMMADEGIPFKTHGEVVEWKGKKIHPNDREAVYYNEIAPRIHDAYPNLRKIAAHISTGVAIQHMVDYGDPYNYICELTSHHFAFDHNILYDGGFIITDHHCLPVVKKTDDWLELCQFVRMMPRYLVAASDMAAHSTKNKYTHRAFGGLYTYHCALELYIQKLAEMGLLDYADSFLYGNAKRFHGDLVPDNPPLIKLIRRNWEVVSRVAFEGGEMTPFGYNDDPKGRFQFEWQVAA